MILSYACAQLWSKDKGICERLSHWHWDTSAPCSSPERQPPPVSSRGTGNISGNRTGWPPRPPGKWRMNDECVQLVSWQGHPRPRLSDPCITPGKGFKELVLTDRQLSRSEQTPPATRSAQRQELCLAECCVGSNGGSQSGDPRGKGMWS